nr:hypothetical protein [Mucilaginibacter sp. X4EP1]
MANFTKELPLKPTYLKYETANFNLCFYVRNGPCFSL